MNGLTCKAHCIGVYLRKSQRTNKQSKFPRFAPPTRGNPWGTRWRSLSANQNRLNWGQLPLWSDFLQYHLCFFWLERIIWNKIWPNWLRGGDPSHTEVSGFWLHLPTPVTNTHRLSGGKNMWQHWKRFLRAVCYVQKFVMRDSRSIGCNNKF